MFAILFVDVSCMSTMSDEFPYDSRTPGGCHSEWCSTISSGCIDVAMAFLQEAFHNLCPSLPVYDTVTQDGITTVSSNGSFVLIQQIPNVHTEW